MKYYVSLISVLLLFSCKSKVLKTNPFSENIEFSKTDKHERIQGTKLFGIIPESYNYVKQLSRYEISDEQFIQFQNLPGRSWGEFRKNANAEAFGEGLILFEDITFNGFNGLYIEGEDPNSNKNDLMVVYGGPDFVTMIVAKTTKDNHLGRVELIDIIKTLYHDNEYDLDEMELATFDFDKSFLGFKLSMASNNLFIYSKNGKTDLDDTYAEMFFIQVLPKLSDSKLLDYFNSILDNHESKSIKILNRNFKMQKVNIADGIVLDSEIEFNGKSGVLYQALLNNKTSPLIVSGIGYENITEFRQNVIETINSITIKK